MLRLLPTFRKFIVPFYSFHCLNEGVLWKLWKDKKAIIVLNCTILYFRIEFSLIFNDYWSETNILSINQTLQYLNIRILPYKLRHVKLTMRFVALTYSFFNLDKLLIFSFVSTLLSNTITFMFSHYQQILYPNRVKTRRHVRNTRRCLFLYDKITIVKLSRKYEYGIDINTTNTRIITE